MPATASYKTKSHTLLRISEVLQQHRIASRAMYPRGSTSMQIGLERKKERKKEKGKENGLCKEATAKRGTAGESPQEQLKAHQLRHQPPSLPHDYQLCLLFWGDAASHDPLHQLQILLPRLPEVPLSCSQLLSDLLQLASTPAQCLGRACAPCGHTAQPAHKRE